MPARMMPVDEIAISAVGGELVGAFLVDDVLTRIEIGGRAANDRQGGRIGDIVLGRVHRVDRDLAAAFIDLGGGRFGFLARSGISKPAFGAAGRAHKKLGEGDAVLVQISREAEGDKAARLTNAVVLPGRTVILLPHRAEARVSRRMGDSAARARLGCLLGDLGGGDLGSGEHGWFVRNAAAAASNDAVMADAAKLISVWQEIEARVATARAPARLYRAVDPLLAAIADEAGPGLRRILADVPAVLAAVRQLYPDLAPLCALSAGTGALFDGLGISAQIEAALEPSVPLPGGGAIHIAETPALIAIDVDSGAGRGGGAERTALAVNMAAVDILAREIGLRDLAGHIVVDFVAMRHRANRAALIERLRLAFAGDRQETRVAGYTGLGKVELMRRRTRPIPSPAPLRRLFRMSWPWRCPRAALG